MKSAKKYMPHGIDLEAALLLILTRQDRPMSWGRLRVGMERWTDRPEKPLRRCLDRGLVCYAGIQPGDPSDEQFYRLTAKGIDYLYPEAKASSRASLSKGPHGSRRGTYHRHKPHYQGREDRRGSERGDGGRVGDA